MRIFFKVLLIIFFIITSIFIIFSSRNFIVNENLFIYNWHIYLSIIISLSFFISSVRKKGSFYQSLKSEKSNPYFFAILSITILPFILILVFEKFLFYPFHFITKNNTHILNLTIERKSFGKNGNLCINFNEYSSLNYTRICGIDDKTFNKIKIGDKMKITVEYSTFGIKPISHQY